MCCGRIRAAMRNANRQTGSVAPPGPVPRGLPGSGRLSGLARGTAAGAVAAVMIGYVEHSPIRVWGPVTGRPYDFPGAGAMLPVDARDAAALTRSDLFRRAS